MQSSYKVIKNTAIVTEGKKAIVTEFESKEVADQKELGETNARMFIDSYENLAKSLIENARRQGEKMISDAFAQAEELEKEAYERGYKSGHEKGYNEGFNKAYEEGYQKNLDKALYEGELIKNNADNILKSAQEQKDEYLKEKEEELKSLVLNCVENMLKREVKDKEALNNIVFEAMSQIKNTKSFIIKANPIYCDEFKNNIENWKNQMGYRGDVFVIADDSIEEGTVIIERDNGKTVAGINEALDKLKEMFTEM